MTRSQTHLVIALVSWSTFYGGLAAVGARPFDASSVLTKASSHDSERGCHISRAPRRGAGEDDGLRYSEAVLATSDDWFALGSATRECYEYYRCRIDSGPAFVRVRDLLAQNAHIASVSVDEPYVHILMPGRPEYVVFVNTIGPDCFERRAR